MQQSTLLLLLLALLTYTPASATSIELDILSETAVTVGRGANAPFWFHANRFGVGSLETTYGYQRAAVAGESTFKQNTDWHYAFGLDAVGGLNLQAPFSVQQAYADLSWRWLTLTGGSKAYEPEIGNRLLGTGGMVYSGNARPIPQIRIEVPHYVPLGKGFVAMKGHIAYGLFTDNRFQREFTGGDFSYLSNTFFHSKALFMRFGKEDAPIQFEGGSLWYGQFGGTKYMPDGEILHIPNRLTNFLRMLLPLPGGSNSLEIDQANVEGNHIGSWLFALTIKPAPGWQIHASLDHMFEDHSQLFGEYGWRDGLWSLELKTPRNPIISTLRYECMNSRYQSGALIWDRSDELPYILSGRDNYLIHAVFGSWQQGGFGIGTPVIFTPLYNQQTLYAQFPGADQYNTPNGTRTDFLSNRALMHHVGLSGNPFRDWSYRTLFTYTQHWGTYGSPFNEISKTYSGMLEVNYQPEMGRLRGWRFSLAGAFDQSDWIGQNQSFNLTIAKRLSFSTQQVKPLSQNRKNAN